MINMLRTLMEEVDSIQEQMNNVSRDREIIRKNFKNTLKDSVEKVNNMCEEIGDFNREMETILKNSKTEKYPIRNKEFT